MSYVVHIWEAPRPASIEEAATVALDMGGDVLGQNPAFTVLAERLKLRYPCLATHPDTSVWSDAPLDGVTDERAYVLGIRSGHTRVLAYLAEQANGLGLCVYDMQQHRAWLPGATLPLPMPRAPLAIEGMAPDDSLSFAEFKYGLRRFLHRVFGPLGYVADTDGLSCTLLLPFGWIQVGTAAVNYDPSFKFGFYFTIRHDRAAMITASLQDMQPEYRGQACTMWMHLRDFMDGEDDSPYVEGQSQFEAALGKTEQVLRERVLPLLARLRTLEAIERYANVEAEPCDSNFPGDITLAWLANNPEWEAIGQARIAALNPRNMITRLMLGRLIAFLRTADRMDPHDLPRGQFESIPDFIAAYDGTQREAFACIGAGVWGTSDFSDGNDNYRQHLVYQAGRHAATTPLLAHDLFLAELALARAQNQWQRLCNAAMLLLQHGGVDALALLVESADAGQIRSWQPHTNLPGPLARVLSSVCGQRAYALGGHPDAERYRTLVEVLEPAAASWS